MDFSKRLLFGAPDPRLEFRSSQTNGIHRLSSHEEIPLNDPYWKAYYTLFDGPLDVFTLIQPSDIRNALVRQPKNVYNLVITLCNHMFDLIKDESFPHSTAESFPTSTAALTAQFNSILKTTTSSDKSTNSSSDNASRQMLNCIRVLSRILPAIFELDDNNVFQNKLLFTPVQLNTQESTPSVQQNNLESNQSHFVIDDEDEDDDQHQQQQHQESGNGNNDNTTPKPEAASGPCLGEDLIKMVVDLLFCAGFTIPADLGVENKINYAIWEPGIGASIGSGSTRQLKANRIEVLRLLIVLLSNRTVYLDPSEIYEDEDYEANVGGGNNDQTNDNNNNSNSNSAKITSFHTLLNTIVPKKTILCLFCSLVNSGLRTGSLNVLSASEKVVLRREDVDSNLISMCLQTLSVCLLGDILQEDIQQQQQAPNINTSQRSNTSSTASASNSSNRFIWSLTKLHRPSDLIYLFYHVVDILAIAAQGNAFTAALPVSLPDLPQGPRNPKPQTMGPPSVLEALVFFWKLWDANPRFQQVVLEDEKKSTEFIVYLVFYCLESKDDKAKHGLLRLCAFILQTLTAKRHLAVNLNATADLHGAYLRSKYSVQGSYNDFIVQSIYAIVFSSNTSVTALYPAFILAINNLSPYVKHLSVTSSTRLLQLFIALSNPACLISDDDAPRLVNWMLEVFNNIIHCQLSDNPNLIYAILRSSGRFQTLATFSLQGALKEINRQPRRHQRRSRTNSEASNDGSNRMRPSRSNSLAESADTSASSLPLFDAEDDIEMSYSQDNNNNDNSIATASGQDGDQQPTSPKPISEKARGKMREVFPEDQNQTDDSTNPTTPAEPTTTWVSKTGFIPTEEWVASWREGLPLDTILVVISELHPTVTKLVSSSKQNGTKAALDYLKGATLVGLLPPQPQLKARPFVASQSSHILLEGLIWGLVYVSTTQQQLPLFAGTNVRLFGIKTKSDELFTAAVARVRNLFG